MAASARLARRGRAAQKIVTMGVADTAAAHIGIRRRELAKLRSSRCVAFLLAQPGLLACLKATRANCRTNDVRGDSHDALDLDPASAKSRHVSFSWFRSENTQGFETSPSAHSIPESSRAIFLRLRRIVSPAGARS